ncbi:MAG: 4Fe-4S binding protein [Candidatus Gastranaerophilaceae bacterium]
MSRIKIDKKKCKACYLCIDVCPKKLIKKGTEANGLGNFPVDFEDPDNQCLGCAMCAMRCPDLAITEVIKVNG